LRLGQLPDGGKTESGAKQLAGRLRAVVNRLRSDAEAQRSLA
jgi:hypothetical protein